MIEGGNGCLDFGGLSCTENAESAENHIAFRSSLRYNHFESDPGDFGSTMSTLKVDKRIPLTPNSVSAKKPLYS
jgi:hypothetical protein